jgi:hypothetical protein
MDVQPGVCSATGVRGVDGSGAVEVVLAADGLPERIRPLACWARVVGVGRMGVAVEEAFAAAHRAHVAACTTGLGAAALPGPRRPGPRPHPPPAAPPGPRRPGPRPHPPPAAHPTGGWRTGRELLDSAEDAMAGVAGDPPAGVGRSPAAPVTITLTEPSTLRCSLDDRWAAAVGPAHAEAALAEALAAARADLATATEERAAAATALRDLTTTVIDQINSLRGRP